MHPHPDVLALLALGETDAATETERSHIESCEECFSELQAFSRLATVGRSVDGAELLVPAPHVWDRVQAEISLLPETGHADGPAIDGRPVASADTVDLATVDTVETAETSEASVSPINSAASRSSRTNRRALIIGAVAAVAALIVGVATGFGIGRGGTPATTLAQGQLAAQPGWTGASGTARLVRDADGKRMLMVSINTSQPLTGTQAVWLFDPAAPDQMRMLGFLDPTSGQWPVPETIDVSKFSQVDVSEEPPDDTSATHSGNSIVRGPLTS